jgi:hypothetical protein
MKIPSRRGNSYHALALSPAAAAERHAIFFARTVPGPAQR